MVENFANFEQAREQGIEYSLLFGRRQPLHQEHLKTIRKNMEQGLVPIIVIGSCNEAVKENGFDDGLFSPLKNPLTLEQQKEQLRRALHDKEEGKDYVLVGYKDLGNNNLWCRNLVNKLNGEIEIDGKHPDLRDKTMHYFVGKPEDAVAQRTLEDGSVKHQYSWEETFTEMNFPALVEQPTSPTMAASQLRVKDLRNLSDKEKSAFADPEYIVFLAKQARAANPSAEALEAANIPLTMLDLSLDRLAKEKHISTAQIISALQADGQELTIDSLKNKADELNKTTQVKATVPVNIMSGSCNQTSYDFATNVKNICAAIDKAEKANVDILALEEMGLVGYGADDYHQWNKNNDHVWEALQLIAKYAKDKNPNLVISVGAPWHYADKSFPADDPQYNINNRPFNTQITIAGGEVVAISAKSILADGAAEYEPRQFNAWPVSKGTIEIALPNGKKVPFGKPVVGLQAADGRHITLFHEICAEGWPGVGDDSSINNREKEQARYLARLSKDTDIGVVLNPSASKPQPSLDKESIRSKGLCETGSQHCGAYIYTNFLGTNSGTMAAEGSQIFAQNGKIVHHGDRYSFKDVSTSSLVAEIPLAERNYKPDVEIKHHFSDKHVVGEATGAENVFEYAEKSDLKHEEYARSIALWMRDYMQKQPFCQGFVVSLSGGKDSAYGAVEVASMVELEVKENGIKGFFEHFPKLEYKDEALKIEQAEGEKAAIAAIKKNLLTCVYLPTDISSKETQDAARFLIEGGTLVEVLAKDEQGNVLKDEHDQPITKKIYFDQTLDKIENNQLTKWVKDNKKETYEIVNIEHDIQGIGGNFYVAPQQRIVDEAIIGSSGLDLTRFARENKDIALQGLNTENLSEEDQLHISEGRIKKIITNYIYAPLGSHPKLPDYISAACKQEIPTWSDPAFDVALQNYQARVRVITPGALGNIQKKIALVTSNASESALGYTTIGGDMHMGGANPIGGIQKHDITAGLAYMEANGLAELKPIKALSLINQQAPSAELRQEVAGEAKQTDEKDFGFTYPQGDKMVDVIVLDRNTPTEAFEILKQDDLFPKDSVALRNMMLKFTNAWERGQFKRTAATRAPHTGKNVTPHDDVRTHEIGDHFKTHMAELSLDVLYEKLGEHGFRAKTGMSLQTAHKMAIFDKEFKTGLLEADFDKLQDSIKELSEQVRKSPTYELDQGFQLAA